MSLAIASADLHRSNIDFPTFHKPRAQDMPVAWHPEFLGIFKWVQPILKRKFPTENKLPENSPLKNISPGLYFGILRYTMNK